MIYITILLKYDSFIEKQFYYFFGAKVNTISRSNRAGSEGTGNGDAL